MNITRMVHGKPYATELTYEEKEEAYLEIRRSYFEEDFTNRCVDRLQKGTGLCNLPYATLPEESGLLNAAHEYYWKIHDCNIDFNTTTDAVVDYMEELIQRDGGVFHG